MEGKQIYHEKQKLQFCLLHALNNLFQEKDSFTRAGLNAIADKLIIDDPNRNRWTPVSLIFKPHHNVLTGNYDINILIAALDDRGKKVVWHDRRNGASSINISEESLMGIVLNIPVKRLRGLWEGRHWVTLRSIGGVWYNFDSDLKVAKAFEHEKEVTEFLDSVISQGGEVLIISHNNSEKQSISLPEVALDNNNKGSDSMLLGKRLEEVSLGKLAEMMVEMLPDDLAFTIFLPSEAAFQRVLKLHSSDSLTKQKVNDTVAILSRLMGFSAVPRRVPSGAVPFYKEISFDSVSGFRLFVWKSSNGILVVNNVQSEIVDLRKGEIIVHVINGVIMDAELEQSFAADYED